MFYSKVNKKEKSGASPDGFDVLFLLTQPFVECFYGIKKGSFPTLPCAVAALVFNIIHIAKLDRLFIGEFSNRWIHVTYILYGSFLSFYLMGMVQTMIRRRIINRLTEAFQETGLKSPLGKLPGFLSDIPIDESTRRLRLSNAFLPLSQFKAAKDYLEASLHIYIDDIRENRARGTVDLLYAHDEMPKSVRLELSLLGSNEFFVGRTRSDLIKTTFDQTPHLLIGGQTGGGKSTFLRQLITSLYIKNRDFQFTLIDLKGGLEFQTFESLPRIQVVSSVDRARTSLNELGSVLEARQRLLKKNNCKDINQFFALPFEDRILENGVEKSRNLSRHIVVIDEAAELFLAGSYGKSADVQEARRVAARIAALGRAVGIHMIVATQKPDVKAVDGQIKANLTGMLAFPMPNIACSQSILNSNRAAELPGIPGRAIWKSGLEQREIQTPFMTAEEATKLLSPFRNESVQ